jgi:hypothetical protein
MDGRNQTLHYKALKSTPPTPGSGHYLREAQFHPGFADVAKSTLVLLT